MVTNVNIHHTEHIFIFKVRFFIRNVLFQVHIHPRAVIPRQSPCGGDDVRYCGRWSVRAIAAHHAVEEGRSPAWRPRSRAWSATPGDELSIVKAIRTGNIEIVIFKGIVVVILIILIILILVLVLILQSILQQQ